MSDDQPNTKGEPASFSPHECRINGRWLIWPVIIVVVAFVVFVLWTIFFGQPTSSAAY